MSEPLLDVSFLGIDWNTFSAIATGIGTFIALVALFVAYLALRSQIVSSKVALGADLLFRLVDRWDSDDMVKKRATAARGRLANPDARPTDVVVLDKINDVLRFFEFVGYLLGAKVISLEGVWVNLSDDAVATWYAYQPFIDPDRHKDKTLWEDFRNLELKMEAESRRRSVPEYQIIPSDPEITNFLEGEAALDVQAPLTHES